jgi:Hemerythrin HHE cation binding domain
MARARRRSTIVARMKDIAVSTSPDTPAAELPDPIRTFRGSHQAIFHGLAELRRVPSLAEALKEARATAQATLELFDGDVVIHHVDEEKELFVAVMASARGTVHEERVDDLVSRLTAEHRRVERLWADLRPAMKAIAAGREHNHPRFHQAVQELTRAYGEHACLEEESFLPLADQILSRDPNHLAALDLSLHMRHVPMPRMGYV